MKQVFIAILLLMIFPNIAQAQTKLMVKPAVLELDTNTQKAQISLYNASDEPLGIKSSTTLLEVDRQGALKPKMPPIAVSGISIEQSDENIIIEPGKSAILTVEISKDVSVAPHVPGIFILTKPQALPEDKTASGLSAAIVVPILRYESEKDQILQLIRHDAPILTTNNQASFEGVVNNPGKSPTKVVGTIIIKNLLGQEIHRMETPEQIILPGQTRVIGNGDSLLWKPRLLLGIYKSEFRLNHAQKSLTSERLFAGLPHRYALLLAIGALIASGIYLRVRKYH